MVRESLTLLELVGWSDEDPHRSDIGWYIPAFREWEYDKGSRRGLAAAFCNDIMLPSRLEAAFQEHDYETLKERLSAWLDARPEDELRELYDIVVADVRSRDDGNKRIYDHLVDAYVRVLRKFEGFSWALSIIHRHLEPEFGEEHFIDRQTAARVLGKVSLEEMVNSDPVILVGIKKDGLTRGYVQTMVGSLEAKDRYRNQLHEEIKGAARTLGYTDRDVMADIVFRYHSNFRLAPYSGVRHDEHELVLNFGVLCLPWDSQYEGELCAGVARDQWGFYDPTTQRNYALDVLANRRLGRGDYHGNLTNNGEEGDLALCKKIVEERPTLSVRYGFEPSHAAHGQAVFALNLRIPTASLTIQDGDERALVEFLAFLKDTIPPRW